MSVATAHSITLIGATGHLIDVQVDVSQGLVATTMVGRPDSAINEGRERCRMAIQNSSLDWPTTRRVTVLFSPADLPKSGPHFDLAVAVAVLGATGQLGDADLRDVVFIGELTLDGRLRSVHGVLPMTMAASARGIGRVFVPEPQVREASMVPGMEVIGVRSLAQVVALLKGDPDVPGAPPVDPISGSRLLTWRGQDRIGQVDLRDVRGMPDARYALEVAAAGGHHILLNGPQGSGKTTLAERLPGLLPDLSLEESLELTAIHSLAGVLDPGAELIRRPPFYAPHSSSSRSSLLGGGAGRVKPGDISKAHCGVVFLDEFPQFNADIIEALRQPLEGGEITIGRGDESATFPARGQFIFACNPCGCGRYHPKNRDHGCVCGEVKRRDYRRKLVGPVADRIDIVRFVEPLSRNESNDRFAIQESTAEVRERVEAARAVQTERYAGLPWRTNAQVPGSELEQRWPLDSHGYRRIEDALSADRLTRRGATRVHRLAWTVADLAGHTSPTAIDVDTALRLRTSEPLLMSNVGRLVG